MDLMQWIVPDEARGTLQLLWAPTWADRTPSVDGGVMLHRRGAPLSSRWLPAPIAIAAPADRLLDDGRDPGLDGRPGSCALHISFVIDAEGRAPLLPGDADDVRFASTLSEFVRCLADLCDAAGLPIMSVVPVDQRRGAAVVLGPLSGWSAQRLSDALLCSTTALQLCALARGFATADARLVAQGARGVDGARSIPVDAHLEAALRNLAGAR